MSEDNKEMSISSENELQFEGFNKRKSEFRPSWILKNEDEFKAFPESIRRRVSILHRTPSIVLDPDHLREIYFRVLDEIAAEKIKEEDAGLFLSRLSEKIEELDAVKKEPIQEIVREFKRGEPEIESLPLPETGAECVRVIEDKLFSLLEKAITERKGTKNFAHEYRAIEALIRKIPNNEDYRGIKEGTLSVYFHNRFPEGVYLKEKLQLFYEAMRNLTDRVVEVEDAEGSLLKLGAEKPELALAKELQIGFTNITPVDWYVLCHIEELFPEADSIPETKVRLQEAWNIWRSIGDSPYIKRGEEWKLEVFLRRVHSKEGDFFEIVEKGERKTRDEDDGFTLEDFYTSEAVEGLVRKAIIEKLSVGKGSVASARSELLAWCFLRVGLTFDLWDRERWKTKGDNGARDLMWFPVKQISRLVSMRAGGGILETAGSYWALEGQSKKAEELRKKSEEGEEIYRTLKRNEEDCIFFISANRRNEGTVIGDFWSSTVFRDKNGKLIKLKEKNLTDIPWLDPESGIEDGTYAGYFSYSLGMAKEVVNTILEMGGKEWSPENLANPDFWKRKKDLLIRIPEFCPALLDKSKNEKLRMVQWFCLNFARGVLWFGSYKSQPREKILGVISKERRGIFTFEESMKILNAIRVSGFLEKDFYRNLEFYWVSCNFLRKGAIKR